MHSLCALLAATVLGHLALESSVVPAPARETPVVLRDAGYEFRYFKRDLGDESFLITRTPEGYRIDATIELGIGDQPPSRATYELDDQRRLVRATYNELIEGGASAEYSVEDGVLIARRTDGVSAEESRITLEEGAIVTGPHYVTDFFVLEPLGLPVGERHEQVAYAFGFDGWAPSRVTLKSKREKDRTVKDFHGNKVKATVYRCEIVTPGKTFRTRSFLDDDGVSVRITVSAPIGALKVLLD